MKTIYQKKPLSNKYKNWCLKRAGLLLFSSSLWASCNSSGFQSLKEADGRFSMASLSKESSFKRVYVKEEFFLEEKKALLDMLFIVDTSPSMYHHLGQLGHSLSSALSFISNYNWQIGFTSADHGDSQNFHAFQQSWKDHVLNPYGQYGGLMNLEDGHRILKSKILSPKISNYEEVFLHTISHLPSLNCKRPPYCHSGLEQPLRSLKSAMQRASLDNRSLFRPSADFVSIIITNEPERKEDSKRATTAEHVVRTFNKVFGHLDKKFIAFNILVTDDSSSSSCLESEREKSHVAHVSHSIAELAELTGGHNINICSSDYGQELKKLSQHIKNSLENSVLLSQEPVPGTVRVDFIKGAKKEWRQYGRNIIFKNTDSRPIHVQISYQVQK